jgi:hypothetical protein
MGQLSIQDARKQKKVTIQETRLIVIIPLFVLHT